MGCTPSSVIPDDIEVHEPEVQMLAPEGKAFLAPASCSWKQQIVPLEQLQTQHVYQLQNTVYVCFTRGTPSVPGAETCDAILDGGGLYRLCFRFQSSEGRESTTREESSIWSVPASSKPAIKPSAPSLQEPDEVVESAVRWDSTTADDRYGVLDRATYTHRQTIHAYERPQRSVLWNLLLSGSGTAGKAEESSKLMRNKRSLRITVSEGRRWVFFNDTKSQTFKVVYYLDRSSEVRPLGHTVLSFGPLPPEDDENKDYVSPVPEKRRAAKGEADATPPPSNAPPPPVPTLATAPGPGEYWIAEVVVPPLTTVAFLEGKVRGGYRFLCSETNDADTAIQQFLQYSTIARRITRAPTSSMKPSSSAAPGNRLQ